MAGSIPRQSNFGAFVPTTYNWDMSLLQSIDVNSPQFKDLLVRLYQNINNINLVLNIKDSGYYSEQEFLNGQLFFPNPNLSSTTSQTPEYRQVFRTVVNFGALPNNSATSVAHNIDVTSEYTTTRIYGSATNSTATSFIPLPYISDTLTDSDNISLEMTDTDIVITTAIDYSDYTTCYVIVEYIKQ